MKFIFSVRYKIFALVFLIQLLVITEMILTSKIDLIAVKLQAINTNED